MVFFQKIPKLEHKLIDKSQFYCFNTISTKEGVNKMISSILNLILSIALTYYFFIFIEMNSYVKNVAIYAVGNFLISIITNAIDGQPLHIFSTLIMSIIISLAIVKIMEFARNHTNSFVGFVVLSELVLVLITFVISFLLSLVGLL